MVTEGIVLGSKLYYKGINVDKAKLEVAKKLLPLVNLKAQEAFLDM